MECPQTPDQAIYKSKVPGDFRSSQTMQTERTSKMNFTGRDESRADFPNYMVRFCNP